LKREASAMIPAKTEANLTPIASSRGLGWLEGTYYGPPLAFRSLSREPSFGITVALVLALRSIARKARTER